MVSTRLWLYKKTVVEKFILSFLKNIKDKLDKEFLDIENRKDLSDDEKVHQLITIGSGVCAGIAVQPIPFADYFELIYEDCDD